MIYPDGVPCAVTAAIDAVDEARAEVEKAVAAKRRSETTKT